jgi:GNAT superfamily N-acetyltransferase
MDGSGWTPRLATVDDVERVAWLLDCFNAEFDTPTPGVSVLAERLRTLLAGDRTFALMAGEPAMALALVTLRPNVWFEGQVALLDELYVDASLRNQRIGTAMIAALFEQCDERGVDLIEINVDAGDADAQRFYERHGFNGMEPDTGERAYYYSMERE